MLEVMLKGSGYEVASAANGAEALEKLNAEEFDLIISAALMPVMDGFQLCRKVKGNKDLNHIIFIFYTATYTEKKDEELALKMEADKFIRKPVEPDEFIKIIQGVIRDMKKGKGKVKPWEADLEEEKEVFNLYSERLVKKLEKKMLDLEREINQRKLAEEERKKLEAQLRHAHKMEAIGTLAGGVAHDFNNILTIIIGNADLALKNLDKDNPSREDLWEIKIAAERAVSFTRQLLAFSRKQIITPRVMDLNELLTDIEKMLSRLVGEDVELLTIPEPVLWQVEVDHGQMEQVIMNLAINARNAMPTGGKLTIETANIDLAENYFYNHGIKKEPGSYVMLAVSDTGSGMDEKIKEHIFDPFFTTNEQGKGTGLGLSTVYGIVKQNNGFVWVYSEPGHGVPPSRSICPG